MKKTDSLRKNFAKIFGVVAALGVVAGGIFLATMNINNKPAAAATYQTLISETFDGNSTTAGRWSVGGSDGGQACLTAGDANTAATSVRACDSTVDDPLGDGALRLTNADAGKSGFIFLDTPIDLGDGLDVTFDMFIYGGTQYIGKTGDGMSFFFFDGSANPTGVNAGNSLGYIGLQPGLAGVGFDSFGNFWANKCQGADIECYPNTIGVKGDFAHNNQNVGTPYFTPQPLSVATTNRENAMRSVHILINQEKQMLVEVDYHDGNGYVLAQQVDLNAANPDPVVNSVKIGFAASTGGATDIHEIRDLTIKQLAPRLTISTSIANNQTRVATGDNFTLNLRVENNPAARNANQADTLVHYNIPANLSVVSLPANCSMDGASSVVCTISASCPIHASSVVAARAAADDCPGGIPAGEFREFQIVLRGEIPGEANNSSSVYGGGDPDCNAAGICAASVPIEVYIGPCKYNPAILSNDANCVPACDYNSAILSNDPNCAPACPYDPQKLSIDKNCKEPTTEIPANPELPTKISPLVPAAPNTGIRFFAKSFSDFSRIF